jgi:hypothetical protein
MQRHGKQPDVYVYFCSVGVIGSARSPVCHRVLWVGLVSDLSRSYA